MSSWHQVLFQQWTYITYIVRVCMYCSAFQGHWPAGAWALQSRPSIGSNSHVAGPQQPSRDVRRLASRRLQHETFRRCGSGGGGGAVGVMQCIQCSQWRSPWYDTTHTHMAVYTAQ